MTTVTKKVQAPVIQIDEDVTYRGQSIGVVCESTKSITLDILPYSLVMRGWQKKRAIMLYRAMPRIMRYAKSRGYIVYGGVWFPNLEKETMAAYYDEALSRYEDASEEKVGEDSLERES